MTEPVAETAHRALHEECPRGPVRGLIHGYYRLLQILLTALISILIVPVMLQVLSRYTGMIPRYIWTEEIARFCFIWMIMIGSMIAVRDGTHFEVDILPDSRSPKFELVSNLLVYVALLLAGAIFIIYGYDFALLGSRQKSEIFGLPMLSIYIAWPVSGLTWSIFLAERIWLSLQQFRRGEAG